MIVNPGLRRATGGRRPIFSLKLMASLMPEIFQGSSTPTMTRATAAYVKDFEARLVQVLAGEPRFTGARRVRNMLAATELWTVSPWGNPVALNITLVTNTAEGPDGRPIAQQLTYAASTYARQQFDGVALVIGKTYTLSIWIKSSTTDQLNINDGAGVTKFTISPTASWVHYSFTWQDTAGSTTWFQIRNNANTARDVYLAYPQFEDVTGQSNQNPSEYVSVGVLSAPYHGAGVDGVQYFTTLNGNTAASNVVTEATGAVINTTNGASSKTNDANGPFGYFAEGARTNLCLQSQTLGVTWVAHDVSVVADQYVAPDGTTTADKILAANTSGVGHYIAESVGASFSAVANTYSVYIKYVNNQWISIQAFDGTNNFAAAFDVLNGVAGNLAPGTTSTITPTAIAGVYRVTITFTPLAVAATVYIGLQPSNTALITTWAAAGTEAVGVWGAQLEAASFASTYIPTTTVAVTKNIDVEKYVSSGNLASAAMTIALDWTPEAAGMGTVFMFGTYVDASNYTAILHDGTNVVARKRIAGANHDATKALTYTANTKYRIVARFDDTNGVDVWVAGVKGTGDATTTASQIGTNFELGSDGNGANSGFGATRNFAVYGSGLSDARAAAL